MALLRVSDIFSRRSPGVKWMVIVRLALSSERFLDQEIEAHDVSSAGPLRTMGVAPCDYSLPAS